MSDELILTPGGYRPKSQIFLVEPGNIIDASGGRLRKLAPDGKVLADYGPLPIRSARTPRSSSTATATGAVSPATNSWVANTWWPNFTGSPIQLFTATWTVPPAPATSAGQLIYLFNGIENVSCIFQPVLQWGTDPNATGGPYWQIATWYVYGPNGPASHSTPIPVKPGDTLTGTITCVGKSASNTWSIGYWGSAEKQSSTAAPAMVSLGEKLYLAFVATDGSNDLYVSSSPDGAYWSEGYQVSNTAMVPQQSLTAPALASMGGKYYLAFVATDLYVWESTGTSVVNNNGVPQQSKTAPALAVFEQSLYLAFVATDGTNDIYTCSSTDGKNWVEFHPVSNATTKVNQQGLTAPAMASVGESLYLAFVATDGSNDLYVCSLTNLYTGAWSVNAVTNAAGVRQQSKTAPALVSFEQSLYLAFVATDGSDDVYVCRSTDGQNWLDFERVGQQSKTAPAMASFGTNLYLAFVSTDGSDDIYVCSYPNTTFSYTGAFELNGRPIESYPIYNVQELKWCCITLEAHLLTNCSDYPAITKTDFIGIQIRTMDGEFPSLVWEPINAVTDCGQQAAVVSNANNASPGGEVDIYYSGI
jgi:hypothetical protein